jgi:hypothetical protein
LEDGTQYEYYGAAHAARQADAKAAVESLQDPDAAIVLRVRETDSDVVRVYRTTAADLELLHVVWIRPARRITPDLRGINDAQDRVGDAQITNGNEPLWDPLDAPDDRDLEVSSRSGIVRIDRFALIEALSRGLQSVQLADVSLRY